MKQNKTNFIEWNSSVLISSFRKIDFNLLMIVILDSAFYLMAASSYFLWDKFMKAKAAAVNLPSDPSELANLLTTLGPEKAQVVAAQIKSYFFLLVFSFILLIILVIFLASIFKSIIWAKTTKTKITLKSMSDFLLLNLIWMGFWTVITFLISYLIQPQSVPVFFLIIFVLGIYFTNILYPDFLQNRSLKSIGKSLKLGIAKIHLFILPTVLIFLVFFILLWATSKIIFNYSFFVSDLILIIYAALVRYYASELTIEAAKR